MYLYCIGGVFLLQRVYGHPLGGADERRARYGQNWELWCVQRTGPHGEQVLLEDFDIFSVAGPEPPFFNQLMRPPLPSHLSINANFITLPSINQLRVKKILTILLQWFSGEAKIRDWWREPAVLPLQLEVPQHDPRQDWPRAPVVLLSGASPVLGAALRDRGATPVLLSVGEVDG